MNNWKNSLLIPATLVLAWLGPAAYPQQPPAPTSSAKSSPTPDTRAVRSDGQSQPGSATRNTLAACSAAVDDLIVTRQLAEALDAENSALRERLENEKQSAALLRELSETRKSENAALAAALSAKNQTIAAKDAAIATQDKLIEQLKQKKSSPWRRLGDILIGAAIAAVLK